MRIKNFGLAILLFLPVMSSHGQGAMTQIEYFEKSVTFVPDLISEHCASAVPELSSRLKEENKKLEVRLRAALQPRIMKLSADENAHKPVSLEDLSSLNKIKTLMLDSLRKREAKPFCEQFVVNLGVLDVDQLVEETEQRYTQILEKAKAVK